MIARRQNKANRTLTLAILNDIFWPQDPYVRLLCKMFGHRPPGKTASFDMLIYGLQQGCVALPMDMKERETFVPAMDEAIRTLPEREQRVVRLYFGFSCEPETLEQIGERLKVKRERVRQLRWRALMVIRSFCVKKLGCRFVSMWSDFPKVVRLLEQELDQLTETLRETRAELHRKNMELRTLLALVPGNSGQLKSSGVTVIDGGERARMRMLLDRGVDELEVSVRCYNCMRLVGSGRLFDVVQKTEAELLERRNFGRVSLAELTVELKRLGLSLGMDVSRYYI